MNLNLLSCRPSNNPLHKQKIQWQNYPIIVLMQQSRTGPHSSPHSKKPTQNIHHNVLHIWYSTDSTCICIWYLSFAKTARLYQQGLFCAPEPATKLYSSISINILIWPLPLRFHSPSFNWQSSFFFVVPREPLVASEGLITRAPI